MKIRGVNTRLNDNLNAELEQEFINLVDKTTPKLKDSINKSLTSWIKFFEEAVVASGTKKNLDKISQRITFQFNNNKMNNLEKYIRLKDIVGPVMEGKTNVQFDPLSADNLILFQEVQEKYEYHLDLLKKKIIVELQDEPKIKTRADTQSAVYLTRYEGSSANVLRDVIITSNNMVEDINLKRALLQEALKLDDRMVTSITKDNMMIMDYVKDLKDFNEINKNYKEPFEKAAENLIKIDGFVKELNN